MRRSNQFLRLLKAGVFSRRFGITPLSGPLALFGDSITDQNSLKEVGVDVASTQSIGWATYGMMQLGSPFSLVRRTTSAYGDNGDYTFGYGSYSPSDLLNGNRNNDGVYPMTDLAAANPSNLFIHGGSNTAGVSAATNAANIIALWDANRALGRRVFSAEILPRVEGATGTYNSTDLANCYAANAIIEAAAAARGIPFLKWASVVALAPGGFGNPIFFPSTDGVHPNTLGAQRLGIAWADFMRPFCGPAYQPPASGSSAWVTTNPYMTGDVSGTATGWTGSNPTGGTLTRSKVTDDDGTVWQRLTASQSGTYNFWTFRQASGTGTFAPGDVVIPVARVRGVNSGWDMKGVRLWVYSTISGSTAYRWGAYSISNTAAAATPVIDPVSGLIVGTPYTVPANTTGMFTYLQGFGSGSIDVRQIGLVKIA